MPSNECTYLHTYTHNELDQITEEKTLCDLRCDETYSSKYTYDKKGEVLSNKRYKDGVEINLDDKETVFTENEEFDEIGNLIKKTFYENSKVTYTEEYKYEYYKI